MATESIRRAASEGLGFLGAAKALDIERRGSDEGSGILDLMGKRGEDEEEEEEERAAAAAAMAVAALMVLRKATILLLFSTVC